MSQQQNKVLHFFPRGSGPLVSVFICTRGRPDRLRVAIDSCWSLAKEKDLVEFILKVDDDDRPTIDLVNQLVSVLPMKVVVSPRGGGYHDMPMWYKQMAEVAEGDWFFIFNDDAKIVTQDWDQIILGLGTSRPWIGINDLALIWVPTVGRPFAQEFIFLRRGVYKVLGHMAHSPHIDNWMFGLMRFLDFALYTEVKIEHDSDQIEDQTREESVVAHKSSIESLISHAGCRQRVKDLTKLLDYQTKLTNEMVWSDLPREGLNWYWWRNNENSKMEQVASSGIEVLFFKEGKIDGGPKKVTEVGGQWCLRR